MGFSVWDLRFGVESLGLRVECLGFRVEGLGLRVQGLGLRVQGLGLMVEGLDQPPGRKDDQGPLQRLLCLLLCLEFGVGKRRMYLG